MEQVVDDGFMPFKGFKTYYKVVGPAQATKPPLLVVHGGPGGTHNYLLGLAGLAVDRQIIFYDQLGCGNSDRPDDKSLWSIETFLQELVQIREHLQLRDIHLLGHSWGGMLAIEYLLTEPLGIQSAILGSAMVSMPLYQMEVEKLKQDLPGKAYAVMTRHEAAGTTNSEEYDAAYAQYRWRHIFRGATWPAKYDHPKETNGDAAYHKLWGANEAYADGELKNWDRIADLPRLNVPTLITSGQYDELTPHQASITHDSITDSELRIFTAGSHCVHIEQEAEYLAAVQAFLEKHDQLSSSPIGFTS